VGGISGLTQELVRGRRPVLGTAVRGLANNWLRATGVSGTPDIFGDGTGM